MASQGDDECCPQQLWLPITPFVHLLLFERSLELPRRTSPHAEGRKLFKDVANKKSMSLNYKIDSNLTWCHSRPAKTPTRIRPKVICSQMDTRDVRVGCYDRWKKEVGLRGIDRGVAAAVVHQDRPVAIGDPDVVILASWLPLHSKVGELKPQHFPAFNLDCLSLLQVVWVVAGWIVWRGDFTLRLQS